MEQHHKATLVTNLFKSRTDVFATRWEKGEKKGYFPVYRYYHTAINCTKYKIKDWFYYK